MVAASHRLFKQALLFRKRVNLAAGKIPLDRNVKAAMKQIQTAKKQFGKAVHNMSKKCSKSRKKQIANRMGKAQKAKKKAKQALKIAVASATNRAKRKLM